MKCLNFVRTVSCYPKYGPKHFSFLVWRYPSKSSLEITVEITSGQDPKCDALLKLLAQIDIIRMGFC